MIDHGSLNVRDLAAAKAFYAEALEPLGYRVFTELDEHVGFQAGEAGPDFWISRRGGPGTGNHVCFRARDRETVEAFHTAALAAGGADNGPPGLRPHYHENYYGAYVFDPDGNNVEAVCHSPTGG
jgi:catechol 2,3-dioxygenase-like lactoylglutathione lyase family enzyme